MSSAQFIFTMHKVGRYYPPDRRSSRTSRSRSTRAPRSACIGANGAGQVDPAAHHGRASTTDFTGEARLTPGFTVGLLARSRSSTRPRTSWATSMDGVGETAALLERFDEVLAKLGRPRRRLREARRGAGRLEDKIEAAERLGPRPHVEIAMDALRCPPGDADVDQALRRRAAPRRALPAAAAAARPAAPRRAHQPPRRRVGGLARALPAGVPGHGRRRHPRPLLPRQRRRVDPRARPRPGHPVRGQLLVVARAEAGAAAPARRRPTRARQRTLAARARVGAHGAQGAPGQGQGPPRRLREAAGRGQRRRRAATTSSRSSSRRASAWATSSSRPSDLRKGFGDRLLIDDLDFTLPRGGIVGVIGANGAGKTTLFRMIIGAGEARRAARSRVGETVELAYVDQSRDALDAERTVFEEITDGARRRSRSGNREINGRAYVARFNFKGTDQQKKVGDALRRRAQPRPPGQAAQGGRQRAAARRADQRPRRRHAARPRGRRSRRSPAAPWSSATTAGSSTASPPTSSPSRATAQVRWFEGNFRSTRPTATRSSAPRPTSRTASSTSPSPAPTRRPLPRPRANVLWNSPYTAPSPVSYIKHDGASTRSAQFRPRTTRLPGLHTEHFDIRGRGGRGPGRPGRRVSRRPG